MNLTREQVFAIIDTALGHSTADDIEISLSGGAQGALRFARNVPTSSGIVSSVHVSITCIFGHREGTVSVTQLDAASLQDAVRRAEETARVAPENPEYMPRLGPQTYGEPAAWDDATASRGPEDRVAVAGEAISLARGAGLVAAGYLEDYAGWIAYGTSRGLRAHYRYTKSEYTVTARSAGGASGWAGLQSHQTSAVPGDTVTRRAIEKALRSAEPIELPAKPYTAILEPAAVADMLGGMIWSMDRRDADEGRSYFSGKSAGEKVFADGITIVSDPLDPAAPTRPWDGDGQPLRRTVWVENGILRNFPTSRYWAEKQGVAPVPHPRNLLMKGGKGTLDDLVASTEYGVLVTSFWYIRTLDRKTLTLTGLTRDGLFLIENGQVTRPLVNYRWNDSPARVLQNVEAMSEAVLTAGRGAEQALILPALKVRDFQFASISASS